MLSFLPLAQYRAFPKINSMGDVSLMDVLGPAIGACAFVLVMARVREPMRMTLNAQLGAGASGVYLSGRFGIFELAYPAMVIQSSIERSARTAMSASHGWCTPPGIWPITSGVTPFGLSCGRRLLAARCSMQPSPSGSSPEPQGLNGSPN